MREIREYVRLLPKLRAEEDLQRATIIALGTGSLKPGQAQAVRSALRLAARQDPTTSRPLSEAGIKVVKR